jgi:hypothetical protein
MPAQIGLPSCLTDFYKVLFPDLDFSRIAFYEGMPTAHYPGADGMTVATGGGSPDIHVYVRTYNACDEQSVLDIAHELVHASQIQGMTGGGHIPGSWTNYYASHALGCTFINGGGCDNALEKEAYLFANGGCGGFGEVRGLIESGLHRALPCDCSKHPWPVPTQIGGLDYVESVKEALQRFPAAVFRGSKVGRTWCSLFNWIGTLIAAGFGIFGFSSTGGAIGAGLGVIAGIIIGFLLFGGVGAVIGAWLGGLLGGIIGGAIGSLLDSIFSGPSQRIWFTAFKDGAWVIPDVCISRDGHTHTSQSPALAAWGPKLYAVYKAGGSNDLYYNVLDQFGWLTQDKKITHNGHSKTNAAPSLAVYRNLLYAAYKSGSNTDLWYNVFDGTNWQPNDSKITQNGHTKTDSGPALAVFGDVSTGEDRLYIAYKGSGSTDIFYNVFDGTAWLPNDIKITQNGHTKTDTGPALCAYRGALYMAYKGSGGTDIWYNKFENGQWLPQDIKITTNGHTKTSRTPALAVHGNPATGEDRLYMAYRSGSGAEIWYNMFDGASWLPQDIKITTGGKVKTGRGPALAEFGDYLFMVYRDDS